MKSSKKRFNELLGRDDLVFQKTDGAWRVFLPHEVNDENPKPQASRAKRMCHSIKSLRMCNLKPEERIVMKINSQVKSI